MMHVGVKKDERKRTAAGINKYLSNTFWYQSNLQVSSGFVLKSQNAHPISSFTTLFRFFGQFEDYNN